MYVTFVEQLLQRHVLFRNTLQERLYAEHWKSLVGDILVQLIGQNDVSLCFSLKLRAFQFVIVNYGRQEAHIYFGLFLVVADIVFRHLPGLHNHPGFIPPTGVLQTKST